HMGPARRKGDPPASASQSAGIIGVYGAAAGEPNVSRKVP
uniref:Protein phosphatase 1 regulatory subunit 15B n=1 Tax=Pongo abelii TaxID=9601 RepID=A0A8I5TYG3_PONAB